MKTYPSKHLTEPTPKPGTEVWNNPKVDQKYPLEPPKEKQRILRQMLYDKNASRTDRTANRLLEIYRGRYGYRQTASGRWRERDEPSEREQMRISDMIQKQQQARTKNDSQTRLKQQGKVPSKKGKPMFEQSELMSEDLNHFLTTFRKLYASNRSLRFRDWLKALEQMLDDLS